MSGKDLHEVNDLIDRMPGTFYRRSMVGDRALLLITHGCEHITGYTTQDWLTGQVTFKDIICPEFYSHYKKVVDEALRLARPYSVEYQIIKQDGMRLWVWEQGHGVFSGDKLETIEGYITDIDAQKHREVGLERQLESKQQLLEEYKGAVDRSAIVSKTDARGVITYVNEQFCSVSGFQPAELIGATHSIVRHPDTPDIIFKELWSTIQSGKAWIGTLRNRSKSGDDYYVRSAISPITDANGEIVEFISVRFDVTELVKKDQTIRRQTTDQLTGLANRQGLLETLSQNLSGYLIIININDFKLVNEYFGFEVGDQLLCDLAGLLQRIAEQYALKLFRLSGDEFAFFTNEATRDLSFDRICDLIVEMVATNNLKVLETEFALAVTAGASSGACPELLLHADIALHSAKAQNHSVEIYDTYSPLKRQIDNNITWLKRIREAIADDRIEVFAQPIVDASDVESVRYECLMRLREDETFCSPYLFLQAAKNGRLYGDLTRIMVEKACRFFSDRCEVFSLNITASDILNPVTANHILESIKRYAVGERLIFELVESEAIENSELVIDFLDRVKVLGCQLAIDDFGTGYSNFEYLLKLDIDYIKIDGSLIRYIDRDENARIVAATVVDFARRLNVKTVAEYVHSADVEKAAREIGVDYLQGFLLGEPVPLSKL